MVDELVGHSACPRAWTCRDVGCREVGADVARLPEKGKHRGVFLIAQVFSWAVRTGDNRMVEIAVEAGDQLGECPLWDFRTGLLWWLDILKPALQSFDPKTKQHQIYPLPGKNCGCA